MSIRNIYPELVDFQTLLTAERNSSLSKKYNPEVLRFRENFEDNMIEIQESLKSMNLPETRYSSFYVYEPKIRKVIFIDYKSKIIQRALYDVLNPRICKTFISDTYSCIFGRGQLNAMKRLYGWVRYSGKREEKWYYLKLDIEKFFYRIDHDILMRIIQKKVGDRKVVEVLKHYICNASVPFGIPLGRKPSEISYDEMLWDVGIPIGGGLSHMLANMYLDPLDQMCKRKLSMKHYIRYMDDIIVLSSSKQQLHQWKMDIEKFLNEELHLNLNNKTAIRPITQGIEFVGYRVWPTHVTLRKSTSLRMKRRLNGLRKQYKAYEVSLDKVTATVSSYKALMKHCDSYRLQQSMWNNFVLTHEEVQH